MKTEFILFNLANGNSVNNKVDNKNKKDDSNFSDFLNRKISFNNDLLHDKTKPSLHKVKDSSCLKEDNYKKVEGKDKTNQRKKTTKTNDLKKTIEDLIEDKKSKTAKDKFTKAEFERLAIFFEETKSLIIEEVSLSLNITQEETEKILETLGFESLDLLTQGNATNLFLYINEETNLAEIITNEDLTSKYTSFMELLNNMEENFSKDMWQLIGFEDTDIQTIINELTANKQDLEFNNLFEALATHIESQEDDNAVETKGQEQQVSLSQEGQIENSNEDQLLQKGYNADSSLMEQNSSDHEASNLLINEMSKTNDQKDSNSIDFILDNQKPDNEQSNQALDQANSSGLWNDFSGNLNISNNQIINSNENPVHDIFDISKQIIEQIKVKLQPDQTSIEMKLYPEHLGKLAFQVISKNGILTASITTQNEVTKEAIESQLHILKEQLTLQGLKVEDIEVDVGVASFFNNDNGNSESDRPKHNQGRKNISNYWLGTEDEDAAYDMPPDELLISYNQDGITSNTVNYSA